MAAAVVGIVGVVLDLLIRPGLGIVFAGFFVVGCGLAALAVHRRAARVALVAPPLLYVGLVLVEGMLAGSGGGSWLSAQLLNLTTALTEAFPTLVAAMALVLAVTWLRARH